MKKNFATQILLLAVSVLSFVACGKSGGDNPPVASVPVYGFVNGSCYNTTNNTPVAYNLCQQTVGNGGYVWNGTQCLVTNTSTVVDPSLCQNQGYNNGYNNGGYQVGQGAGGPYIWNPYPNGTYPIGYFPTGYPSFPCYGTSGVWPTTPSQQNCNGGIYLFLSGGSYRQVSCYNGSCSGYFMYAPSTYRPILCL
jgi:hypothetical protein